LTDKVRKGTKRLLLQMVPSHSKMAIAFVCCIKGFWRSWW